MVEALFDLDKNLAGDLESSTILTFFEIKEQRSS